MIAMYTKGSVLLLCVCVVGWCTCPDKASFTTEGQLLNEIKALTKYLEHYQ